MTTTAESPLRRACFTVNNYTPYDEDLIREMTTKLAIQYLICGYEVGGNGTPHLQGYVEFVKQVSFGRLKKMLPRAHWERAIADGDANRAYCSKDKNIMLEIGEPKKQGKRSDLDVIRELITQPQPLRQVAKMAKNVQHIKFAESLLKYTEEPRALPVMPYVVWLYGESGVGKSYLAFDILRRKNIPFYTKRETSGKWFDGYDGEEAVVFDNWASRDEKDYLMLLGVCDRYDYRVETKGGSRQMKAKIIFITSVYLPDELFSQYKSGSEIARRITEIYQMWGSVGDRREKQTKILDYFSGENILALNINNAQNHKEGSEETELQIPT